jgi:hypothetical protein
LSAFLVKICVDPLNPATELLSVVNQRRLSQWRCYLGGWQGVTWTVQIADQNFKDFSSDACIDNLTHFYQSVYSSCPNHEASDGDWFLCQRGIWKCPGFERTPKPMGRKLHQSAQSLPIAARMIPSDGEIRCKFVIQTSLDSRKPQKPLGDLVLVFQWTLVRVQKQGQLGGKF